MRYRREILFFIFFSILLVIPLESVDVNYSKWVSDGSFIGDEQNPEWYISALVYSENSTWWFYENQTIELRINALVRPDETGITTFNITGIFIQLKLDHASISLVNESKINRILPNITSLDSSIAYYELALFYELSLTNHSSLINEIGSKFHTNLQFWVNLEETSSVTGKDDHLISNYLHTGVRGWYEKDLVVIFDNPINRIPSILVIWLLALIPGTLWLVGQQSFFSRKLPSAFSNESLMKFLYWSGIALLGLFLIVCISLCWGPIVQILFQEAWAWFSILITFCGGLAASIYFTGMNSEGEDSVPALNQHHRYTDLSSLLQYEFRNQEELDDYWISWKRQDIPRKSYDLVRSNLIFYLYLVYSILVYGGSAFVATPLYFKIIGASLILAMFYGTNCNYQIREDISKAYGKWKESWLLFWKLLYNLTCGTELAFQELDPLKKLRNNSESEETDWDLLLSALGKKRVPKSHHNPEGLKTASLYWFVINELKPKITQLEQTSYRDTMNILVGVVEKMKSPWKHPLGSDFLLRLSTFLHIGLKLGSWAPLLVEDLSVLITDSQKYCYLSDRLTMSKVSDYYLQTDELPWTINYKFFSSFGNMRQFWSLISALLGYPLSTILYLFV